MKKIIVLLMLLTPVSCMVYEPPISNGDRVYNEWKAEQKANQQKLYNYTQSAEFKAKYSGTSEAEKQGLTSPDKSTFIGSDADPMKSIRVTPIGNPQTHQYNVRVYGGSEYNRTNTTQYYNVKVIK